MTPTFKIHLQIRYSGKPDRHYSLRLKQDLKNEPAEYKQPERIIVLPNIEGNFQSFSKFLVKRKIINKYLNWTFGNGHLIIMGNGLNNTEQTIECLWLIYALEEQARREGGYVHFILSSPELLAGIWQATHPRYAPPQPDNKQPATALYHGNKELGFWLRTKNMIEQIGPYLFAPNGIPLSINNFPQSLTKLNQSMHTFDAISWMPGQYLEHSDEKKDEEKIDKILQTFNTNTIITSTLSKGRSSAYFDGKVVTITAETTDESFPGLLIRGKHIYYIGSNGKPKKIK